jgi:hypothetical protein
MTSIDTPIAPAHFPRRRTARWVKLLLLVLTVIVLGIVNAVRSVVAQFSAYQDSVNGETPAPEINVSFDPTFGLIGWVRGKFTWLGNSIEWLGNALGWLADKVWSVEGLLFIGLIAVIIYLLRRPNTRRS